RVGLCARSGARRGRRARACRQLGSGGARGGTAPHPLRTSGDGVGRSDRLRRQRRKPERGAGGSADLRREARRGVAEVRRRAPLRHGRLEVLAYNPRTTQSSVRRSSMTMLRVSRRTFLRTTVAGAAVLGFPRPLRAQARTFKIGVIHPITGPLAEPGQACRLAAQVGADATNAAGGIKSLGGTKLELLLGDTQTKPDVGRSEAERVVNQGAQLLMGSFDSGSTAAMVPVAQQRRVPFRV